MKARYIGILLVLAVIFQACTQEDTLSPEFPQSVNVTVKAYNGSNSKSITRLAYTDSQVEGSGVSVTWSAGDAFYVKSNNKAVNGDFVHGKLNIVEREEYSATEDFSGVLSQTLDEEEPVSAYYPADLYDLEGNVFNVDLRRITQKASDPMSHLSAVNYMKGTGSLNDGVNFQNGNMVAIIRFDLTVPAMDSQVDIVEFQMESGDINTVGKLDVDDASFVSDPVFEMHRQTVCLDGYTAGTSETKLSVYVAMLPTTLEEDIAVKLLFANGNVFSATVEFNLPAKVEACNRYYIIKEVESLVELDYSWYTSAGADAQRYEIGTEGQLFAFASIVNGTATGIEKDTFEGQTVALSNNITLSADWTPIGVSGSNNTDFKGTFDGQEYIVDNINIVEVAPASDAAYGFFGNTNGATIKNITVKGGAFVESSTATSSGHIYLGGIVGRASNTSVENCSNEMNLKGYNKDNLFIGGLAGYFTGGTMKGCSNSGNLESNSAKYPVMGGLMGNGKNNNLIACYVENVELKITGAGTMSYQGGLAGKIDEKAIFVASYSLVDADKMTTDASVTKGQGGLAALCGGQSTGSKAYGCYTVFSNLWDSGSYTSSNNCIYSIAGAINEVTSRNTLNAGIIDWNGTLQEGVANPLYCGFSYVIGNSHLVLKEVANDDQGQLGDMGNGGLIGGVQQ